jgi:hypothetical protein
MAMDKDNTLITSYCLRVIMAPNKDEKKRPEVQKSNQLFQINFFLK